jgi:hypothetical protein
MSVTSQSPFSTLTIESGNHNASLHVTHLINKIFLSNYFQIIFDSVI